MKNKFSLLLFSVIIASSLKANIVFTKLQMRNPIELRTPIMNDSINPKGQKYQIKNLLNTPIVLNLKNAPLTTIEADTSGVFSFKKADKNAVLYLFKTKVRANKFSKATMSVSCPTRFQVFVDGKSMTKQTTVSKDAKKSVSLRFEPETTYDLAFEVLSLAEDTIAPSLALKLDIDTTFKNIEITKGPSIKNRFLLENTQYGNKTSNVSLSPDGKYLLTSYSFTNIKNKNKNWTTLSDVKTGKIILNKITDNMKWMPKSGKLYYLYTEKSGYNIVTVDPNTLDEKTIAYNIPTTDFNWSPNEDYIIMNIYESGVKEKGPLRRIVNTTDRVPNTRGRFFLSIYNFKTGAKECLTYGNHSTSLQTISPDGSHLIYKTNHDVPNKYPFSYSSMFKVDLSTLKIDTIYSEKAFIGGATYSPDGKKLVISGGPAAFNKIGQNCGNHKIANDYDKQLFIYDLATKKVTPITKYFNPSATVLQWNADDDRIYIKGEDKDSVNIFAYSPETKEFEKLNTNAAVTYRFSIAKYNANVAAYVGQTSYDAGFSYLYNIKKRTSTLIADPLKEQLKGIELGTVEPWNFTASDGTVIQGRMCLPPHFDASKKYPLLVYYYGGTSPTPRGISSPYCEQLFASRNYVVYVVQPSGATGFGQEFSARHVNTWGIRSSDDIIEGTKQFCKEHSFINSKKIGCLGASYGGFMTEYLQTRTDIFAAATAHAGISNVTSYWGEGYWGVGYNTVAAAKSYPWNNPDLFTKQGALFNADKIKTPLLLLQGTADTNVPIGESIQLFNALKILGKTVEFVTVDGENHFILDYSKRNLWHNTIMAWFAKWLQDDSSWWNELYPERHL